MIYFCVIPFISHDSFFSWDMITFARFFFSLMVHYFRMWFFIWFIYLLMILFSLHMIHLFTCDSFTHSRFIFHMILLHDLFTFFFFKYSLHDPFIYPWLIFSQYIYFHMLHFSTWFLLSHAMFTHDFVEFHLFIVHVLSLFEYDFFFLHILWKWCYLSRDVIKKKSGGLILCVFMIWKGLLLSHDTYSYFYLCIFICALDRVSLDVNCMWFAFQIKR